MHSTRSLFLLIVSVCIWLGVAASTVRAGVLDMYGSVTWKYSSTIIAPINEGWIEIDPLLNIQSCSGKDENFALDVYATTNPFIQGVPTDHLLFGSPWILIKPNGTTKAGFVGSRWAPKIGRTLPNGHYYLVMILKSRTSEQGQVIERLEDSYVFPDQLDLTTRGRTQVQQGTGYALPGCNGSSNGDDDGGPGDGNGLDPGTSWGNARKFTGIPNDITVPLGGTIDLRVAWGGEGSALWYKDYAPISDFDASGRRTLTYLPRRESHTETRLVIQRAEASDAGDYWVTVSNPTLSDRGITTTRRIRVTVGGSDGGVQDTFPAITTPPRSQSVVLGGSVTFSVTATGNSLSYQWRKSAQGSTTDIPGAIGATYTISSAKYSDDGTYMVLVRNSKGAVTGGGGTLIVTTPVATAPPAPTARAATSVSSSGFTANWSAVSGVTGYILDISTSSTFSSFISGYQNVGVGSGLSASVSGLSAGTTYYFRVRAYNTNGVSNNSATITVITPRDLTPSKPDLIVTSITLSPAIIEEGKSAWVTAEIKNSGTGAAGASKTRLSFSPKDDFISTDDARFDLFMLNVPTLAAGQTQTVQWDLIMPNLGTGTYDFWPLVEVDVNNSIAESNELNIYKNAVSSKAKDAVSTKADLILSAISLSPLVVEEGKATLVTATIQNDGGTAAVATRVRLQFSPKNDGDETDDAKFDAPLNIPALAVGNTYVVQWNVIMPNLGTDTYDFWPIVAVDVDNAIAESNENNLFISGVAFTAKDAPLPDLQLADVKVLVASRSSTIAEEGKNLQIQAVIKNGGQGNAAATRARLRLSPKDDWNIADDFASDVLVAVPALGAGSTFTAQWNIAMPNLGTGTYDFWPLVDVDLDNSVAETDEKNSYKSNVSYKAKDAPLPGLADIQLADITVVAGPTPNSIAEENKNIQIQAVVKNGGLANAPATRARLGLSPKDDKDTSDDFRFEVLVSVPALAMGNSFTAIWNIVMPNLGAGIYDYWVVVEVDIDSVVAESEEKNVWRSGEPFKARDAVIGNAARVTGDFDRDGLPDIIFQDADGFMARALFMNGGDLVSASSFAPSQIGDLSYRIAGSGDFNGDGKEDLLFQHTDGTLAVWYLDGVNMTSSTFLNPANPGDRKWRVVATTDLNKDGKVDLLFQHADGSLAVWHMDGIKSSSAALLSPKSPGDAKWRAAGAGDFNADGRPDLVFQHDDGTLAVWLLNGATLVQPLLLNPSKPGAGWRVVSVADRNGDGKSDLLFQNTNLDLAVWFLDGVKLTTARMLNPSNPGGTWKVVGPR